jgi:hypothetical protein
MACKTALRRVSLPAMFKRTKSPATKLFSEAREKVFPRGAPDKSSYQEEKSPATKLPSSLQERGIKIFGRKGAPNKT